MAIEIYNCKNSYSGEHSCIPYNQTEIKCVLCNKIFLSKVKQNEL